VKIIEFSFLNLKSTEKTLNELVNQGWQIVTAGGGGSIPSYIVVLQRTKASDYT